MGRITVPEMQDLIKRQLLTTTLATRGPGCDPANAQCRAVADAIAAKHAAEFAQTINDAIDQGQAILFDSTMSPAQIAATLAFARSDAGRAFAASLRASPGKNPALASRIRPSMKAPPAPFDEFYDAAKDLPRAKVVIAPPPPAPPPPLRRDR
jgi:hypothetical protein